MITTLYHDTNGNDVTTESRRELRRILKDIPTEGLVALFLILASDPDEEVRSLFEDVIYNVAYSLQCDGRLVFMSDHYNEMDTASMELVSMLQDLAPTSGR